MEKKYRVNSVKHLGCFSAEEVDAMNGNWIVAVMNDNGGFDVFVEGNRNIIVDGPYVFCPVGMEDRIEEVK